MTGLRHIAVVVVVVTLAGCGPTRTAGTKRLAAKDLAILSIAQLPDIAQVTIHSIRFDDHADEYKIGDGRDFYLTPGPHTASFTLRAPAPPGPGGWFVPDKALVFPGPRGVPLGTVTAGKAYDFAPTVESFQTLMQEGKLSLVREKPK